MKFTPNYRPPPPPTSPRPRPRQGGAPPSCGPIPDINPSLDSFPSPTQKPLTELLPIPKRKPSLDSFPSPRETPHKRGYPLLL